MIHAFTSPLMPRPNEKPTEKPADTAVEMAAEKPLPRHLVIIDGVDHVVMAADEVDLQKQIAALRNEAELQNKNRTPREAALPSA